jgi:ketosteroid isomerase-like protein
VSDAIDVQAVAAWMDKLAIQELIVTYSDAATRGDWDAFSTLWAPDAVWEVGQPIGSRVEGAEEIIRVASTNVDSEDFLVQMPHGSVVTLHGDGRATATTLIHALARRGDDHAVTNYGVYYDDLVELGGAWKFARRLLQPVYAETEPLPGNVPLSRDDLKRLG